VPVAACAVRAYPGVALQFHPAGVVPLPGERFGYRAGVRVIGVPYHLDEYLPDLDFPLEPAEAVAADLPGGDVWERLAALSSLVGQAVARVASRSECPVVISGDCTTALGTVAGLQRAGLMPGIVWFDAHGDVQTLETTASGYLGGLPLRLLAGYRPELIAARLGLQPVPERQILLAGARDLDPPEVIYLASARIRRSDATGLGPAGLPDGPLYVHLDLDVTDPAEIPGLRYPAPGGPGPAQVTSALRMLLGTGRVAAIGIACTWYPGHSAAALIAPHLAAVLTTDT
jgi:arginase